MSIADQVHAEAVRKASNNRVEGDAAKKYEERHGRANKGSGVRPLGSRVTTKQVEITAEVVTEQQIAQLRGNDELLDALKVYAETGDASALSGEQNEVLKAVVVAGRERSRETASDSKSADSQSRRFWPRKVAAIIAQYDAQPPAVEPEKEPDNEGEQGDEQGEPEDSDDTPSSSEESVTDEELNGETTDSSRSRSKKADGE